MQIRLPRTVFKVGNTALGDFPENIAEMGVSVPLSTIVWPGNENLRLPPSFLYNSVFVGRYHKETSLDKKWVPFWSNELGTTIIHFFSKVTFATWCKSEKFLWLVLWVLHHSMEISGLFCLYNFKGNQFLRI